MLLAGRYPQIRIAHRRFRRSIQLSNPNQVVSGQHEQIAQVRDLEHFVCLEHDA